MTGIAMATSLTAATSSGLSLNAVQARVTMARTSSHAGTASAIRDAAPPRAENPDMSTKRTCEWARSCSGWVSTQTCSARA